MLKIPFGSFEPHMFLPEQALLKEKNGIFEIFIYILFSLTVLTWWYLLVFVKVQTKQIWCNATSNVFEKRLFPRIEKNRKKRRLIFLLNNMVIRKPPSFLTSILESIDNEESIISNKNVDWICQSKQNIFWFMTS